MKRCKCKRPVLAVRYHYDLDWFEQKGDVAPKATKGGCANLRIDLLATAVAVASGIGAVAIAILSARVKKAIRKGRR